MQGPSSPESQSSPHQITNSKFTASLKVKDSPENGRSSVDQNYDFSSINEQKSDSHIVTQSRHAENKNAGEITTKSEKDLYPQDNFQIQLSGVQQNSKIANQFRKVKPKEEMVHSKRGQERFMGEPMEYLSPTQQYGNSTQLQQNYTNYSKTESDPLLFSGCLDKATDSYAQQEEKTLDVNAIPFDIGDDVLPTNLLDLETKEDGLMNGTLPIVEETQYEPLQPLDFDVIKSDVEILNPNFESASDFLKLDGEANQFSQPSVLIGNIMARGPQLEETYTNHHSLPIRESVSDSEALEKKESISPLKSYNTLQCISSTSGGFSDQFSRDIADLNVLPMQTKMDQDTDTSSRKLSGSKLKNLLQRNQSEKKREKLYISRRNLEMDNRAECKQVLEDRKKYSQLAEQQQCNPKYERTQLNNTARSSFHETPCSVESSKVESKEQKKTPRDHETMHMNELVNEQRTHKLSPSTQSQRNSYPSQYVYQVENYNPQNPFQAADAEQHYQHNSEQKSSTSHTISQEHYSSKNRDSQAYAQKMTQSMNIEPNRHDLQFKKTNYQDQQAIYQAKTTNKPHDASTTEKFVKSDSMPNFSAAQFMPPMYSYSESCPVPQNTSMCSNFNVMHVRPIVGPQFLPNEMYGACLPHAAVPIHHSNSRLYTQPIIGQDIVVPFVKNQKEDQVCSTSSETRNKERIRYSNAENAFPNQDGKMDSTSRAQKSSQSTSKRDARHPRIRKGPEVRTESQQMNVQSHNFSQMSIHSHDDRTNRQLGFTSTSEFFQGLEDSFEESGEGKNNRFVSNKGETASQNQSSQHESKSSSKQKKKIDKHNLDGPSQSHSHASNSSVANASDKTKSSVLSKHSNNGYSKLQQLDSILSSSSRYVTSSTSDSKCSSLEFFLESELSHPNQGIQHSSLDTGYGKYQGSSAENNKIQNSLEDNEMCKGEPKYLAGKDMFDQSPHHLPRLWVSSKHRKSSEYYMTTY